MWFASGVRAMNIFWMVTNVGLWIVVLLLAFVLWGALRALALLRWRLEELEAITPKRIGRSGLRPGKKAPDFKLSAISGGEVTLNHFANRKLLLVFMQPGCGPCHQITPELNRLHHAGEIQVLVIHNADAEAVQRWIKQFQPDFPVAVQERFAVSRRYEVFATPFAFLIDERGVIAARGIVSTKQYLGFVLTRAGHHDNAGDSGGESSEESQGLAADAAEASLSSKEVDHV
jgi:methylamine dehydrogenase accessory protein MauD